ncbi:hypothetical protein JCM6882_007276 [Rhodosporidiobolus microsporus]
MPPPAQPSRVRPFLLRGTSGAAGAPRDAVKGSARTGEVKAAKEDDAKLRRSKTIPGLETAAAGGPTSYKAVKGSTAMASSRTTTAAAAKPPATKRTSAIRPLSLAGPSLRPLSSTSSTLSSSRPRPLLHPELPSEPADATPTSRTRPLHHPDLPSESAAVPPAAVAPPPASSTSLEAVERLKLQKKRETLLARSRQRQQQQQQQGRLSSLAIRRDSPTLGEGGDGSPIARSKRWFSKLTTAGGEAGEEDENVPPSSTATSVGGEVRSSSRSRLGNDLSNSTSLTRSRRDRSPTPPFFASTSPNPPRSPVKKAAQAAQRFSSAPASALAPTPATPPPKMALRAPSRLAGQGAAKKRGYAGLGVVRVKRSREELRKKEVEEDAADEEGEVEEGMKHEEGYSSLQELLERHGYRDTRVVTPQSKPRLAPSSSPSTPAAAPPHSSSSTSLVPPASSAGAGVKEKSSMLSLRGLFSLWGPSSSSAADPPPPVPFLPAPSDAVRDSPNGSNNTLGKQQRIRSTRDMREWVSGVETAMAYSSSSSSSVGGSYAPTPQLEPSMRRAPASAAQAAGDTFGSPTSGRSYSSSLSLSASPPTPNSLRRVTSPAQPTLALSCASPAGASLSPYGTCAGTARQSLRHVVSESALGGGGAGGATGGYQSLTGLGIALPPSFLHDDPYSSRAAADDDDEDDAHTPTPSTPSVHVTPPAPPPGALSSGNGYSWLAPTAHFFLRQRASQVFSPFGAASSAVDAATGTTATQRWEAQAAAAGAEGKSRLGGGGGRPKLLRKAMSSAGLVRPVTTQAVVGTKSSAESLSLSIESVLSSSPGEEGVFGGEDLLGRRW